METQPLRLDEVIKQSDVPIKRICAACDISRDTLTRWRKGVNPIPSDKLPILARVLDAPISEFMSWPEDVAA